MKDTISFLDKLKEEGYKITEKHLGGGFVNEVKLITVKGKKQVMEFVFKRYGSEKDLADMLRGYSLISEKIKTPKLIHVDKKRKEVIYELIKGKNIGDMIRNKDPEVNNALISLADLLKELHNSKRYKPNYKKGNSPDEKKMIKHCLSALKKDHLSIQEVDAIMKEIRNYVPKTKSIIHGDAHLGNFIYSNGETFLIDPDNIKIGDLNADIGKILRTIEMLEEEEKLSPGESESIKNLFLKRYGEVDEKGVNLLKLRWPLKFAKEYKNHQQPIYKILGGLKTSSAFMLFIFSISLTLFLGLNITGRAISPFYSSSNFFYLTIIFLGLFLLVFWFFRRNNGKKFI